MIRLKSLLNENNTGFKVGDKVRINKREFEKRYSAYELYSDTGKVWDIERSDYATDDYIVYVKVNHKDPGLGKHDVLPFEPKDQDLLKVV